MGCRHWPCLLVCPSVSAPSLEPPEHPLVLSTLGAHPSPLALPHRPGSGCHAGNWERLTDLWAKSARLFVSVFPSASVTLRTHIRSCLKLNFFFFFFFRKRTKSLPSLHPPPSQSVNPECSFRQQQQDQSQNQTPISSSFHPAPRKGKGGPGLPRTGNTPHQNVKWGLRT